MSSLNDLLNPESSYESSLRLQAVRSPSSSNTSPTEKAAEPINAVEIKPPPPPRSEVIIRAHEPHPDCPDTLACLPDTDGRPQHTLPVILRCTILGSPRKRLTIREIYAAMERKYPYYKTAGPAWKQSVRHHLSLNRLFERQPRPPSDPGFGSYWTVNLDAPPGTKRPRKRGGRSNKMDGSEAGTLTVLGPSSSSPPPAMHMVPRTLPALPGPPAPSMPAASSLQNQSQPPQPPPSATPSTTSTVASAPSNTPSTSSTANSASVRPPLSPQSPRHSPEDRPQAHSTSPRSPSHVHPQSLMQPHSHLRQHPHTLVQSQPPHSLLKQSSHAHPHQSSQVHGQSSHALIHPPPPSHSKPPSHNHSQPPQHAHPQGQTHAHPPMHPHSLNPGHERPLQQQPQQASAHPHVQQSPYAHPPSHVPPPSQQSSHSNSSHSHSHPPHGHSHSHTQRPSINANNHTQSVSTIATLRPVDSRSFSHGPPMRSRAIYDDDDDDEMDWEEDGNGGPYSDDDYSSSEDMPYKYDPRHHSHGSNSYAGPSHRSYSASQAQPGRSVLHGAFSGYSSVDQPETTIERLKMEMSGLRRQSQDAVNASLRLSDELRASQEEAARAKEEATRAKAALKVAENMLEEEARRRIQAEKTIEEEARRRLAAEDALRQAEDVLRQYQPQAQAQRKSTGYSARS
ncbi:hypothetical protein BD414DRAFT_443237 [Trametes punicea]|nr:hypothetical protein BD414DRAFT_443237 [Trametes punicea]